MAQIYLTKNYKDYIAVTLDERAGLGERGTRSRLADFIGSQSAYVSRVLNGDAHFSLEQADLINQFLKHSANESEYFFLLVQFARAGTASLRAHFEEKLKSLREDHLNIRNRIDVKTTMSEPDQILYFNSWLNAAVHVALLVPEFQNLEKLAQRLSVSVGQLSETISFLTSMGLVEKKRGRFLPGTKRLHLAKESPIINRHHVNWRLRAIDAVEKSGGHGGMHYSSVVSLSREDVDAVKEILIKAIQKSKAVIKDSKEETLASFCLDFYEL